MSVVYALVSSGEPDLVRYVGRTKYDSPDKRLSNHIKSAKAGGRYHVHNWIRKVEESGFNVVAVILESDLSWEDSGKREIYWITYYNECGFDLTNMTSGGDGVFDLSAESRERHRQKMIGKGHPQSEETKRKISETRKAKNIRPSDEVREKYRQAKLGKKMSVETKEKISKSTKGKPKSETTRVKMSEWQIGRVLSEEHKEKVSSTLKEYYSKESGRLPGGRIRRNND